MAKKSDFGTCRHRKVDVAGKNTCDYFDARNRSVKRPVCSNCSAFESKDEAKQEAPPEDQTGEQHA